MKKTVDKINTSPDEIKTGYFECCKLGSGFYFPEHKLETIYVINVNNLSIIPNTRMFSYQMKISSILFDTKLNGAKENKFDFSKCFNSIIY